MGVGELLLNPQGWLWSLPFLGTLLTIALAPLFAQGLWHRHYGKLAGFWALLLLGGQGFFFGTDFLSHQLVETLGHHFVPFIIFIATLYITTSGLKITLNATPTVLFNTLFLGGAGLMASVIGTTGAAMLFIYPFIHLNRTRVHKTHLIIFFIFAVCNVGGGLSPIGDPPLFLGYLEGVDFFWPLKFMARPVIGILLGLLIIFYGLDFMYFRREKHPTHTRQKITWHMKGLPHLFLLLVAVGLIASVKSWQMTQSFSFLGVSFQQDALLRDLGLLIISVASLLIRKKPIEKEKLLNWEPLLEVTKLFAVIFVTAAPVLATLKLAQGGDFAALHTLLHTSTGLPKNDLYFWFSGILSSFLDNAPTYLIFFHMAGGDAQMLMGPMAQTLLAISMGSVFMGAMTYIGNAPNFMVKSIAEMHEIQMPTFLGYLLWSCGILLPLLLLMGFWCVSCGI